MATQSNSIPDSGYGNTYIDSLVWGCQWTGGDITYAFGNGYIAGADHIPGNYSDNWASAQSNAFNTVLQLYENVANLSFSQVSFNSPFNNTSANIVVYQLPNAYWGETGILGQFDVPDGKNTVNRGYFNNEVPSWSNLNQGSYGFITLIHEFGHALGLAHPHDGGDKADATVFPGVTSPFESYGTYDLNQGIWTVMSYNDGWNLHPAKNNDYGWEATPMALDIAALQAIYGENTTYNAGNNTYRLPTVNSSGTFWSCLWDAGGTDTINNTGSNLACTIDLRAAPLVGANAGGYVSYNNNIIGGYTIAHDAVIENAIGGGGNDTIYGNNANNILNGGAGNDTAVFLNSFAQAGIRYSSSTNAFTITTILGGTDTLSNIETFRFSDQTRTAASLMSPQVDITAPTVVSFSPSDGATNVTISNNIILSYSEAIQRGTGTIVLKNAAGTVIESFNAATSNRLSIAGATLTIDPTNMLNPNTHYYLTLSAGTIKDLAANAYAGTNSYDFTTTTPEPSATITTTATLAVGASINGSIEQTGDHDWYKINLNAGTGYRFDQIAAPSSSLDTYLILRNSTGQQLAFDDDNGSSTNALLAYTPTQSGVYYLDAGAYSNSSSGAYSLRATVPSLSDNTPPSVVRFSPGDGAINADVTNNITVTFNEAIQRGIGAIVLKNAVGTIIESFNAANSNRLSISGATLTIDPINALASNSHYSLSFAASTVKDLANNAYTGTNSYDFTTAAADPVGNLTTTATLNAGSEIRGFIAPNGDHDWFKITLSSGSVYRFDQIAPTGSNLDAYLTLLDSTGRQISSNDDGGVFQDAHITYTATRTGIYYLDVGSYNDTSTGDYLLQSSQSILASPVYGTAGNDTLNGTSTDDNLFGLAGNDTIYGRLGGDLMTGGTGNDDYYVDNVGDVVTETTGAGTDTIYSEYNYYTLNDNIENLLFYGIGNFIGNGNALNNYIEGDIGNDNLYGDDGNDHLNGLAGNDVLDGGLGTDTMEGGPGDDLYYVDNINDRVNESVGSGDDTVLTVANNYTLGNNIEQLLFYGTGNFIGKGNGLDNYLEGDISNDILYGYADDDTLNGLAGADNLIGGLGKDRLTGGLGPDKFKFNAATETGITTSTRDIIIDFSRSQSDKIDLSAIDANSAVALNNAFLAPTVGNHFSGAFAGQGQLYFDTTTQILYGNNDTDSPADFSIQLTAVSSLAATDFVL